MIKSITIENFKSIKKLKLEIPEYVVLLGSNGAGKTNILKAVKLIALLAAGEKIEEALAKVQVIYDELYFDPSQKQILFSIELMLNGKVVTYSFEIKQEEGGKFGVTRETLVNGLRNKPILERSGNEIIISPDEGGMAKKDFPLVDNQLALALLPSPSSVSGVKKFLSSIIVADFNSFQLRLPGQMGIKMVGVERNLAESLYDIENKYPTEYEHIKAEYKKMVKDLEDFETRQAKENILFIDFKEKKLAGSYTLLSASDGNLRTLAVLVAAMGGEKPSAIFVDEIENSMHPARIRAVIRLLEYLSDRELNKIQVILTTHNPIVVDSVREEQIMFVYKRGGGTKVTKPIQNVEVLTSQMIKSGERVSLGELFKTGVLEALYTRGRKK